MNSFDYTQPKYTNDLSFLQGLITSSFPKEIDGHC